MADAVTRWVEEKLPGSTRWTNMTRIHILSKEDGEEKVARLRRSMPMTEFRLMEIDDDDIPF